MDTAARGRPLLARIRARISVARRRTQFLASIRHLHGPRRLSMGALDVAVVALVRDGAFYLDGFFRHYRAIGARHFVFFDNGSTDGTLARIREEPGTVIVQSTLPWGSFENDFRRYAAEHFLRGHWCLYADMDELFDFEGSTQVGLGGLVAYLDAQGYTALVAQMLEMFPDTPLRDAAHITYDEAIAGFRHCDVSAAIPEPYHSPEIAFEYHLRNNTLGDQAISFMFGGIRGKVFGEHCCLTKHPLVKITGKVRPGVHPHCSSGVDCADFTALIRHYKFTNDPFGRDAALVAQNAIGHGEDRLRLAAIERCAALSLMSPTAFTFSGLADLRARGFLIGSDRYSDWLAASDA